MQNTASIVKCIYEDEGGVGGKGEREGGLVGDVMKRQQAAKWMGPAGRGPAGSAPPLVQCNGQSSCERRSPLFPTTQQWGKTVAWVCQGQVTLLIYTLSLCTQTMHTHNSFIWCVHTATFRLGRRGGQREKTLTLISVTLRPLSSSRPRVLDSEN